VSQSHSLVLGLFPSVKQAATAARALHADGLTREAISVVARSHAEAVALAKDLDASPGVEIEDSRRAARLGELGAMVIAAAAAVMPGTGQLVAAGPLSAELGEAAGHFAGGLASVLTRAGIDPERAAAWQTKVQHGQLLLGVHVDAARAARMEAVLREQGAEAVVLTRWNGDLP
jgi:hypothetical protein